MIIIESPLLRVILAGDNNMIKEFTCTLSVLPNPQGWGILGGMVGATYYQSFGSPTLTIVRSEGINNYYCLYDSASLYSAIDQFVK